MKALLVLGKRRIKFHFRPFPQHLKLKYYCYEVNKGLILISEQYYFSINEIKKKEIKIKSKKSKKLKTK